MPRRLYVLEGADQGRYFALPEDGAVIIGSSERHCDIVLNDLYAARSHCEIAVHGDKAVVTDLSTPNGTLVNKQRIDRHELAFNDVIRVGNTHLRYEEGEVPAGEVIQPRVRHDPDAIPEVSREKLGKLSGYKLGHYELGEVLGVGHLGTVFKARDLKKDADVALKVLGPEFPANDSEMNRFVQVVKPLLAARHPHLVTVLGAGRSHNYMWIARELVVGESAAEVIERHRKQKRIDWRIGCRLAMHVGRALDFATRHHWSHLHLTPSDILISHDGTAKLNDLMMYKALEGSSLFRAVQKTKEKAELPWLAPEQTDPQAYVDDLADLYRLGAIVYAVLTGRPPFEDDDAERLRHRIRNEFPDKPTRYQKSIPIELQAVVLRLMAKHPEERYANAAQMLAELAALAKANGM
ncbi:MAG: protein kinase [Gemmatales bacterium]|nr:protein kinase [Gemmatales bacterium]MDW8385576.1 FHA domain-containing serine/threonine-protein kinase [Gemmatales bacterium]